jgi:predicted DNA-binding protein (UPF0251 family)
MRLNIIRIIQIQLSFLSIYFCLWTKSEDPLVCCIQDLIARLRDLFHVHQKTSLELTDIKQYVFNIDVINARKTMAKKINKLKIINSKGDRWQNNKT